MICQHCNIEIANAGGFSLHEKYCKNNPNRSQRCRSPNAGAKRGSTPWNKGKTGVQSSWKKGKTGLIGYPHTAETKERLSEVAKNRKLGGYVRGSGRGKKGWYKGFFCDSSWELAYVIYCLESKKDIKRNTEKREYIWEGKVKNYIPDFIVDGVVTEVKGFITEQWLAKLEANPDVVVLYEKDLEAILSYVKEKYGKDFIRLYE